jgi:hypothetical protein
MRRCNFILASAVFAVCSFAHAATPDAWAAHYKDVTSSCIKASGLRNARPAGDPVDFDDKVGYTAIIIQGHYPQPHMKNKSGRVLCLYEKRSRMSHVSEADEIIRPIKP